MILAGVAECRVGQANEKKQDVREAEHIVPAHPGADPDRCLRQKQSQRARQDGYANPDGDDDLVDTPGRNACEDFLPCTYHSMTPAASSETRSARDIASEKRDTSGAVSKTMARSKSSRSGSDSSRRKLTRG